MIIQMKTSPLYLSLCSHICRRTKTSQILFHNQDIIPLMKWRWTDHRYHVFKTVFVKIVQPDYHEMSDALNYALQETDLDDICNLFSLFQRMRNLMQWRHLHSSDAPWRRTGRRWCSSFLPSRPTQSRWSSSSSRHSSGFLVCSSPPSFGLR